MRPSNIFYQDFQVIPSPPPIKKLHTFPEVTRKEHDPYRSTGWIYYTFVCYLSEALPPDIM